MKKSVIIISLFLLGTTFSVKAQEMTQKEKTGYTIGIMLGEQIKNSGIDASILETIKEKIDLESIKEGIRDALNGKFKLSKEEIETNLLELQKKIDYYKEMIEAKQSKESESKDEKPQLEKEQNNKDSQKTDEKK